jgi:serine/threonine protein kinase
VDSKPDADIQIAGYRIEARVGRGGMGEVYRAVQLNLGRRVALKILAPELAADDRFRRRFLRESRIAASIDHPSIIPIYETGEDGGLLYIAMRYVDGPDLATVLRREGRLDPTRALAILTQVASALDAAHEHGLVHRDVKPANILLAPGPAGTPSHSYLCDFGLIKQVDSEQVASALTATDQFVGTIPYVAPEQIEGKALDGRTDVYALGCVLFHCLTGSVPFDGANDVEVVFAHLGKPPPSVSERHRGLPASMDAVIARAMAKAKEDRWPTCTALVAALRAEAPTHGAAPAGGDPGAATQALNQIQPADDPTAWSPAPPVPDRRPAPQAPDRHPPPRVPERRPPIRVTDRRPPPPPVPAAGAATEVFVPAAAAPGPAEAGPGPAAPGRPPPADRAPRSRGRRWLTLAAAVVLPVGAYLAAVEVIGRTKEPQVAATPTTVRQASPKPATCRWTRPEVGSPARSAPLAAIRAHMGWTDRFVVDEMRSWTGSDGNWRWYVKAHQEGTPSRRGRWLVGQQEDGQRLVLATAGFTTKGYSARDWRPAPGQGAQLPGLAACLAGT